MKFLSFFSLAIAVTSCLAAPVPELETREPTATLVERANPVTSVITGIRAKVSALNTAIVAWNGGDITKVTAASNALIKAINQGTTTVRNGPALNNVQALALVTPVENLTKQIETTITHLINKKAKVIRAGHLAVVRTALSRQKTAATNLSNAITNKVPPALKSIAAKLSAGIAAAIQKGINAYKTV